MWEDRMGQDRRAFLKTGSFAAAALAGAGGLAVATSAAAQPVAGRPPQLPRGMTFATLAHSGGSTLGIKPERGILDVTAAEPALQEKPPTPIHASFKGRGDVAGLQRVVDKAAASPTPERFFIAADKATFGPCVTHPEKIICIGLNYRRHAAETNNPVPTTPILFNKFNTALNSHGGAVTVSEEDAVKFDYEAELVIVTGRKARNVWEADALTYVFGYCTGNDFPARDLQSRTSQWMLGKSGDGYAPIGPWLVTADQVDGDNLKIE